MLGETAGAFARIKAVALTLLVVCLSLTSTYCKKPASLKTVLVEAVTNTNFIKSPTSATPF